jgi:hypothetical protein
MHMHKLIAPAVIATLLLANTIYAAPFELTTNGDFETGDFTGWTPFPTGPGQQTVTSINPSSAPYAAEIINNVATGNSAIRQVRIGAGIVTSGQTVTISFDARGSYGEGGVANAELFYEIEGGGISSSEILGGGPPLAINGDPDVWTPFLFTTTPVTDVSGGVTLALGASNGAVNNPSTTMWYDNVSVTVDVATIPEPASAVLLGLGGLGLLIRRRRRG